MKHTIENLMKEVEDTVVIYKDRIVYRDKIVEKEVCTAPAGVEAFTVEESSFFNGDVYTTTDGRLIIITGTTSSGVGSIITTDRVFRLAPASLPAPDSSSWGESGTKGKYYFLYHGDIAYADFL